MLFPLFSLFLCCFLYFFFLVTDVILKENKKAYKTLLLTLFVFFFFFLSFAFIILSLSLEEINNTIIVIISTIDIIIYTPHHTHTHITTLWWSISIFLLDTFLSWIFLSAFHFVKTNFYFSTISAYIFSYDTFIMSFKHNCVYYFCWDENIVFDVLLIEACNG